MKTFLALLTTLLLTCAAHSQSRPDTTCLPSADLRRALQRLEAARLDAVALHQLRGQHAALLVRIATKDSAAAALEQQAQTLRMLASNYTLQLQAEQLHTERAKEQVADIARQLRQQKRKTVFIGVGSATVLAGLLYIIAK